MGALRASIAALCISSLSLTATAGPNDKKGPTPAQLQQAGDLVKKAIAKSQAGDHVLAIELYQQAYNIIPQPLLLSNIGAEYQSAQKPVEAIKYFCKYLDADPNGSNAGYASAQARSLQITLGNTVDEKDPCHVVPKPPPPPPPVVTDTGAGSGSSVTGTEFGSSSTGTAHEAKPSRALMYAGIGVAVVGAVSLGVGIDFALKGKSLGDQQTNHDPNTAWPTQIDGVPILQWKSQGDAWNKDAYVFSIIGGVALVAGGVMIVVGKNSAAHHAEHVSVTPRAGGATVGYSGSF